MENLFSSKHELISREDKEKLLNQKGVCLWLTGLSGSGKTTIAKTISKKLHKKGIITQVLDGDNIRIGINNNLSFSEEDRLENIRRTSEIGKLFVESGIVTICCLVSPTKKMREKAKSIIGASDFYEIYIATNLPECKKRDTKGLYEKAIRGEIKNFTGISAPYEKPNSPNLVVPTENISIEESSEILYNFAIPLIIKIE
jgi:adenylylsulfate kinase